MPFIWVQVALINWVCHCNYCYINWEVQKKCYIIIYNSRPCYPYWLSITFSFFYWLDREIGTNWTLHGIEKVLRVSDLTWWILQRPFLKTSNDCDSAKSNKKNPLQMSYIREKYCFYLTHWGIDGRSMQAHNAYLPWSII